MSDDFSPVPGPWWLAWLIGAAVPLLLGTLAITIWMSVTTAARDDHSVIWGIWDWTQDFLMTAKLAALPALITALLFVGMAAWAEQHEPKPLLLWLSLGLVATSPLALFGWALANMGDPVLGAPPINPLSWLVSGALICCGMLGAVTAFRVRHRSWQ
jgi:hypothetical protein